MISQQERLYWNNNQNERAIRHRKKISKLCAKPRCIFTVLKCRPQTPPKEPTVLPLQASVCYSLDLKCFSKIYVLKACYMFFDLIVWNPGSSTC